MPYGRLNNTESPTGQPGLNYGRVQRNPTPRVFNSLPGEVVRVLGNYTGSAQCVGGSREVVTDLPTGLFNYQQKLAIINSDTPELGSAVVMPAGSVGHMGVVLKDEGENVLIYDVNADGRNTKMIRRVPKDKIDGYYKGAPDKINQTMLAEVNTSFDSEITKAEQKEIAKAEKEVVKFNTDRVFDEMKGERPNETEELGGIQRLIKETVDKPEFWETYKTGLKTFADPTIGALKGVASTVENASALGQKGLRATTGWIAEKLGFDDAAELLRSQDISQVTPMIEKAIGMTEGVLTTPSNGWQQGGFFLEKVGEFMLPGAAVTKAQKGIAATNAIASLPPKIKGLVQLGIVSASEAATFAGVSAIQEGEVFTEEGRLNPQVKTSAIIGGAFPIAKEALGAAKRFVTPEIKKLLTKAIRPSKAGQKQFTQNIDEVMAAVHKRYPNIKTIEELNKALKDTADDVWKQVDDIMAKTGQKAAVNGNTIADKIIKEMSKETKLIRENPNFLKEVRAFAKQYRGLLPVNEADDILRATNKDLGNFYKRAVNSGLGNANAANATQKMQDALAKALREGIDDAVEVSTKALSQKGGIGAGTLTQKVNQSTVGMKKLYGDKLLDKAGNIPKAQTAHILDDVSRKTGIDFRHLGQNTYKSLEQIQDDILKQSGAVRPLRELYGKIASIAREVDSRATVFSRQNLMNLQQGINVPAGGAKVVTGLASGNVPQAAEGLSQLAASGIIKNMNSANTQIATAFEKLGRTIGAISPSSRGVLGGILSGFSQGSDDARQDRKEFQGRDAIDSIKIPDYSSGLPGGGMLDNIAQSDKFRGLGNLVNAFIPTASAAPKIPEQPQRTLPKLPTPQPVRPTASSLGKVASAVAPNTTRQVGAVQDFLKNVGRLTPAQLEAGAPKSNKSPGVGSFFDPKFSGFARSQQQHKQQLQDANDMLAGRKPTSQKTIAEIYNESDTKKAVDKAKEIFTKSFF